MNDWLFVLYILFFFCALPAGAVWITVWGLRRLLMRGFQSAIPMDAATCLKADDGSVIIRRPVLFLWVVIVVGGAFGFGLLVALLVLGVGLPAEIVGAGIIIEGALFFIVRSAIRSLRLPSIYINANSRILERGRGSTAQQISFSRISYIRTALPTTNILEGVTRIRIQVTLNDGEVIELGSVSGDPNKARTRATAIAQLVAEVTGAAIREPVESIIR